MKDTNDMVVYDILEKKKELGENIANMLEDFNEHIAPISTIDVYCFKDGSCFVKIEVKI